MEKSREQVMLERKLRKAEKQSKKKPSNAATKNEVPANTPPRVNSSMSESSKILTDKNQNHTTKAEPNLDLSIDKVVDKVNELSIDISKKVVESGSKESEVSKPKETATTSQPSDTASKQDGEENKTKAQLKAERRAKQEAQRALKAENQKKLVVEEPSEPKPSSTNKPVSVITSKLAKVTVTRSKNSETFKMKLFGHLHRQASIYQSNVLANSQFPIHKSVIKLGAQYKSKVIIGSNARVIALLETLKQVISDYETPAEKDFSRGFELVLGSTTSYLDACRPVSEPMKNVLKYLKGILSQLPNNIKDDEAKAKLKEAIKVYITCQINLAGKAVYESVQKKISEDDVILTYGYSSLLERIFIKSFEDGKKFRVIIVDAGPLYEGKELLRRLARHGLNCIYVLISATSYIMKEANMVLLGAHALLTNGYVMSRAGSSQVALIAKSYNVPVLVCCETHKFCERVQTDAFVYNELANSEELLNPSLCNKLLDSLALMYEVTPSDLVTAVVTELAILPCTSVPVVLRVKPPSSTS